MNLQGLRGMLIVDKFESPLWRTASSHAKNRNCQVVAAMDYFSPIKFLNYIRLKSPDYIVFMWREAFDAISTSNLLKNKLIDIDPFIFILIPDYLNANTFSDTEQRRIEQSDGVFVTCLDLFEKYSNVYRPKFLKILHDIPDLEIIEDINQKTFLVNRNKIIWVGNSKWGERFGFKDHKGLKKFAIPMVQIIQEKQNNLKFQIIDSAVKKISNHSVLNEISNSGCLIVTSDSEGTGLCILEAAALGTPVVTLDVGIAREIFCDDAESQISQNDIGIFANKVLMTLKNHEKISKQMRLSWRQYFFKIQRDFELIILPLKKEGNWRNENKAYDFKKYIKWHIRYLIYSANKLKDKLLQFS